MSNVFRKFLFCLAEDEFLGTRRGGGRQSPAPSQTPRRVFEVPVSALVGVESLRRSQLGCLSPSASVTARALPFVHPCRFGGSHSIGASICDAAVTPTTANAFPFEPFGSTNRTLE